MLNQYTPYLRNQRDFPNDEVDRLANQVDQAYIDIATKVNERTIGVYVPNNPIVIGNTWFLDGSSMNQEVLRQVYPFNTEVLIPHGISFTSTQLFTAMYGQWTDGVNWYGLIPGTATAIAGQVSFYLDQTNINIVLGAAAPTVQNGVIILEWLSNF